MLTLLTLLFSLVLNGSISSQYGRIGVRVSSTTGGISQVLRVSPAADAGLRKGDVIIEADGVKGHKFTDGMAGTIVHIKVRRGAEVLEFDIPRVPRESVHD